MNTRYLTLGSMSGLIAGIALGLAAYAKQDAGLLTASRFFEAFGMLWTNCLGLLVAPMIFVSVFLAVLSFARTSTAGKIGISAFLVHAVILAVTALLTVTISLWIVPRLPVGLPAPGASLEPVPDSGDTPRLPGGLAAVVTLEPVMKPVRDNLLPVIAVTFLLALASTRLDNNRRKALTDFFRRTALRLTALLNGILLLLPAAVFGLSFALAAETGLSLAGVVTAFIILTSLLLILYTLALYIPASVGGRIPLRIYAAALWPSQAVAAGTRSSLACLPTLLEGAEKLNLPKPAAGFVLPLSVSTFKLTRAVSSPLKLIFLAHVYGIDLSPATIAGFVATSLFLSFSTPGIPSGGTYTILPLYLAAGIPMEGIVLLKGVDAIPDIFKTILHVSEGMAVTSIVSRKERKIP
ncbi:MAG: cation:dicarboxylase symporter family transporter [Acidobacteriota bacterium]|nr:cation:dicarboxylase symporter family transporter [Acidobacteriota bacterium]